MAIRYKTGEGDWMSTVHMEVGELRALLAPLEDSAVLEFDGRLVYVHKPGAMYHPGALYSPDGMIVLEAGKYVPLREGEAGAEAR